MSEYQYYEFRAIDRQLTAAEMVAVRKLSTRARITSMSFVNEYHYGDFKHDPLGVLANYFDAFVYVADWGTRELAFRFPPGSFDPALLKPYLLGNRGDYASGLEQRKNAWILDLEVDGLEDDDFVEGDGYLDALLPLREMILAGDYRPLYLFWLIHAAWGPEHNRDGTEKVQWGPPTPAGLRQLTPALEALIGYFNIDRAIVEAAALASPPLAPREVDYAAQISALTEEERTRFLLQMAHGDPQAGPALRHRLGQLGARENPAAAGPRQTVSDLFTAKQGIRAAQEARAEAEKERQRLQAMEALANREPDLWQGAALLIERRTPASYDEAVRTIESLRSLAVHRGSESEFEARVREIAARHSAKVTFIERLQRAKLL